MTDEKDLLKIAEQDTNTNPTEEQKVSGDYQKGEILIEGLRIVIENPAGSVRSGVDSNGDSWSNKMVYTYGYIDRTIGSDHDEIDVFLGPRIGEEYDVFIVLQVNPETQFFDEHKVMLGFESLNSAREGYLSNYASDWEGLGSILTLSIIDFKDWLKNKSVSNEKEKVMVVQEEKEPVIKVIKLEGEVIEGKTLLDLQEQAGYLSKVDILTVEIASPGGSVSEGLQIMLWFNSLSEKGKIIVTIVTANAYSIASLIMLAANHKLIGKFADVMVHNPMVPEVTYANADELESHAAKLRELEAVMYELYETFTGLSPERIKALMDNETYLDADKAVKYGFADEIVELKQRPKSVAVNKHKITNMSKTLNILNKVIAQVTGLKLVNQLYYDNTGGELEIYQNDPATYATGDKTNVKEGTVTLLDGAVLTIVDNVITDINRDAVVAPSAEEPAVPAIPAVPAEEAPKAEESVAPITEPVKVEEPAASFNEGPAPVTEPVKVEEPVKAVEEPVKVEEAPKMEGGIDPADPTIVAIWEAIEELKEMCSATPGMVKKIEAIERFEQVATKAIETIADNTSSNFKPDASYRTGDAPKGSIFQQAKAKVEAAKKNV